LGSVHSLVPSARPTKLATVFGALSSKSLTLKVPSEVSNVAVVMRLILASVLLLTATLVAQSPFVSMMESLVHGGRQLKGLVAIDLDGQRAEKRYVVVLGGVP